MTKKKSIILKSIFFVLGLGVIALVYYLYTGAKKLVDEQTYFWISVVFMYLVLYCPLIFSEIPVKQHNGKKPSVIMVWLGAIVLVVISVGMSIAVIYHLVQISICIGIECVLAFLFIVDAYFGYFAIPNTANGDSQTDKAFAYIKQIQKSLNQLLLKSQSLNEKYTDERNMLKSLSDLVKDLLPVESATAMKAEQDILFALTTASSACDATLAGKDSADFKKSILSLETLIKQRKNMSEPS
jgi:hypothetical protein